MFQNSGSFYWFFSSNSFFLLLTYAEIKAFYWLKALFFSLSQQKIKEPLEKNRFFGTCKPAVLACRLAILACEVYGKTRVTV